MVNRKGFMRVVEATIAVLLVIGTLLAISIQRNSQSREDITENLPKILEEIARNQTFRENVLSDSENIEMEIRRYVLEKLENPSLDAEARICRLDDPCASTTRVASGEDVYSQERVISATVAGNFQPKKIKVFVWRR